MLDLPLAELPREPLAEEEISFLAMTEEQSRLRTVRGSRAVTSRT